MTSEVLIRLSDVLCILMPDKALDIRRAANTYYDKNKEHEEATLGEYLVDHKVISPGELEYGLVAQTAQVLLLKDASPKEVSNILKRTLVRASEAIDEAQAILNITGDDNGDL